MRAWRPVPRWREVLELVIGALSSAGIWIIVVVGTGIGLGLFVGACLLGIRLVVH
jgi:hypothetical protein